MPDILKSQLCFSRARWCGLCSSSQHKKAWDTTFWRIAFLFSAQMRKKSQWPNFCMLLTQVSSQRHVIKIPLKVWHGLRFLFFKSCSAFSESIYITSLATMPSMTRAAFGKSKVIMWEKGQRFKVLYTLNEPLSNLVSEMSA